jgi:hypothetical protein
MVGMNGLPLLLTVLFGLVGVFFYTLPLLIFWRCGNILRRLKRLERQLDAQERQTRSST